MKPPRVFLVSEERYFKEESLMINQLMELPDFIFHLRKPGSPIENVSGLLKEIHKRFHPRIVIHQCFELALDYNLAGIHLPESERARYSELKSRGYKIISSSIHDLDNFLSLADGFDYLFYSPVFPSISKQGYAPGLSLYELSLQLKKVEDKHKLMALGGVSKSNFEQALNLGFNGVALLGSVWKHPAPLDYFRDFLSVLRGISR